MLAQNRMVAFLSTTDAGRARVFYESVMLQKTDTVTPPHGTALGWIVGDIRAAIQALSARGVVFERFSEMDQDDLGVWSPAPGAGVAWFKDPDGNLLSLSQSAES
jgi:catechol 2,3-dioxygenase-like lactoylglutathione lyase family enzyme